MWSVFFVVTIKKLAMEYAQNKRRNKNLNILLKKKNPTQNKTVMQEIRDKHCKCL